MFMGIIGMILFVSGITILKTGIFALVIAGITLLSKPHLLLQTQEILLGDCYIFLPLSDEKIFFEEIVRIKRSRFQNFYTVEIKKRKAIYFINLSIDNLGDLVLGSDADVIKKLKHLVKSAKTEQ